jgi:hypothetical protein
MVTISLKVSDQLAQRLASLQDHLPEIIELGLRHWQEQEHGQSTLTPRQRVERLWATTGLIVPLDPTGESVFNRTSLGRPDRSSRYV